MGCGASKGGDGGGAFVNMCKSEGCLVRLCKERKDLIRAARDCRYAVAASHVLYLQSLLEFGEALDVFLKEAAVVVGADSPSTSSVSDSPLHSIDGSHLELLSVDSESVFLGSLTDEVHQGEKDGRSNLSSPKASVDTFKNENQVLKKKIVNRMMRFPPEALTETHEPAQEFPAAVYGEYMPPMYYNPDGFGQNYYSHPGYRSWTGSAGKTNTKNNGYTFSEYGDESAVSFPRNSSMQGQSVSDFGSAQPLDYFRSRQQDHMPHAQTSPNPVPSPPMANSTLDYFNLFNVTDNFYSSYYSDNMSEGGLGHEYLYLNYVREEEGIPPLEEILEDTPSEPFNMPIPVHDSQVDINLVTPEAHARPVEPDEGHMTGEKGCNPNNQGEEFASTSHVTENEEKCTGTKDVGSSPSDDKIIDEGDPPSQLIQTTNSRHPTQNILEVAQEINRSFLSAYDSGKEVTEILEAEKIPYLSATSVMKGFYLRILGAIAPSTMTLPTTYMLHKQSARKILKKTGRRSSDMVKDSSYIVGAMTSTLDKLCLWEKKLCREVEIEENLRAEYDKLCKKSKMLEYEGAESDKIDDVQVKIKRLLPKIDVSVSAVRVISRRIQQARDEELHSQISGLIHGRTGPRTT